MARRRHSRPYPARGHAMNDEPKHPMQLLVLDHDRELIAEAVELSNIFLEHDQHGRNDPNRSDWVNLPAKIRAGCTFPFVRDIGDVSTWIDDTRKFG